jgi:hypothetical protein
LALGLPLPLVSTGRRWRYSDSDGANDTIGVGQGAECGQCPISEKYAQ